MREKYGFGSETRAQARSPMPHSDHVKEHWAN